MRTAYENACLVREAILSAAMEAHLYSNWAPEFGISNLRRVVSTLRRDIGTIPLSGFTIDECRNLGFKLWSAAGLYLIPLWLYPFLATGEVLTDISGVQRTVYDNYTVRGNSNYLSDDNRNGVLAYGITPTQSKA